MIISFQCNSYYLICHKKSRLLFALLQAINSLWYDKRWLHTFPCVSWAFTHKKKLLRTIECLKFFWQPSGLPARCFYFVDVTRIQWLVASFLTWHSLHGKPAISAATSRFYAINVTAMLSIHDDLQKCKYFFHFLCFFYYRRYSSNDGLFMK